VTTNNKLSSIVQSCRVIRKMSQPGPYQKSDELYYQNLSTYYTRLLKARENGGFIAAHTVFFPAEILYAMDIVPMHTEMTTWLMALFLGEQAELLSAGAEVGLAAEICSPHRGLAGAFTRGYLPHPDVMLWSNLICDNTAKSGELVMKLCNCPGFFLDHPFQHNNEEVSYLVNELKSMVRFLEEKSGHKMNWDKLSEIVARTNQQLALTNEINELRKLVPSPFAAQGFLKLLLADYLFPGQPEAIAYLQQLRDELKDIVREKNLNPSLEKHRLMTLFIPPIYMTSYLDRLYLKYGAVSVVEPMFTKWTKAEFNPSQALKSVAEKSYVIPESHVMYGPLNENVIKYVVDSARDYQVQGAVFWAFLGCRHACATIKIFKDALNEAGIPMLAVDCDIVDPTVNPEEEIGEKLERFFELLDEL